MQRREKWIHWAQDVEEGAGRQEENGKTSGKIHGCSEGGHAEEAVTKEDARDRLEADNLQKKEKNNNKKNNV